MSVSKDNVKILLCGFYFQGNTGDNLLMESIVETLSRHGEVKVTSTETFEVELLNWCQLLVIGAGSLITPRGIGGYRHAKYAKENGKKVVYYSQTIEEGHPQFREHLARADLITVRDSESKKAVEANGFRAVLASDPILKTRKRSIGFSFRKWVNEPPDIVERLASMLDNLAVDYEIISLPYTENDTDTESDTSFHEQVIHHMKNKPQQAAYDDAFQRVDLFVGMRLHALINGINMGKRVLAINYDTKIRRIFSDLAKNDAIVSYDDLEKIPYLVRNEIFRIDKLALREKVNEALIARMCADIKGEPSPKVSIVMPTYNRANYLKEAIDSILTQTIQDWELIIIDGGSTDNTRELVKSYREERIRYYNFGHNGISYSRNIGNLLSRGEIIAVADSDDVNLPNRLEVSCKEMEKSKADIIYSSMFHFDNTGEKELIPSHPFSYERLKEGNFIYHPTIAYRRDVAMTCPYNEDLEMVEDYHFYLQAAEKGYQFHQVEEPLAMHRLHEGQISSVKGEEMAEIHRRLVDSASGKMKDNPLVSVIVPTYNRPDMLKEALTSILSQTYQNFEVIVVNDAGDDVKDVIDSLNKEGKIIYLQHEENRGLPAARNTGLRAAKGKYIAYLDDDDIYYPNHLETLVNFLENSDYKLAYTDSYYAFKEWITDRYVTVGKKIIYSHDFDRKKLLVSNYFPIINVVHRKDILDDVGLFDETLAAHEDWDLWIRISQQCDFYHINLVTAEVRARSDGTTMTSSDRMPFLKTLQAIHSRYSHLVGDINILEGQKKVEEGLTREVEIRQMSSNVMDYGRLHHYRFAKEFVKDKKVLVLAGGEGYGSFILSEDAESVTCIDKNEHNIRHASSNYIKENLEFIKGSITDVPIKEEKFFDIIVCFEALERIEEHDALMREMKRLLKDDGIFIVSTPNKYISSDQADYQKIPQSKELSFDEFKSLLKKNFKNTLIYGQKVYPSSNIFPLFRGSGTTREYVVEKGDKAFLFVSSERKEARYLIAISSNAPIEDVSGNSYLVDISETLFKWKDYQIRDLKAALRDKDVHTGNLESAIREKDGQIGSLEAVIKDKDARMANLEGVVGEKEATLNHIYNSNGWKTLLWYYRFRDRVLPEGTRRQAMMKLLFRLPSFISGNSVRKGIKYARLYGIKGFFRKVNAKLRYNPPYNIQTKPVSVPVITAFEFNVPEDNIPPEDVKVSVIIPTKDAGEEFDHALCMIRKQKGIRDVELIVVDSGSSDETLEIARKYDAHIISIQPEDFSHSAARNLGAEKASGSFLFFTVQDAILPSERFLYEFYRVLKENGVGAVSCVEFCKENADLIYSAMAWYHAHFLGLDTGDRILSLPEKETHVTLRQNAQLSNTACFVRKDIFDQYRFRFNYAEDLDLGVRLIKDGYKLALLGSVRIIHSHNRPAYYYLKRGYVDSRYLTEILPDFPVPVIRFEDLIRDIVTSYNLLNEFVKEDLLSLHTPCALDHFIEFVKERFKLKEKNRQLVKGSINDIDYVDGNFKDFVEWIRRQLPEEKTTSPYNSILLISLLNFNETVFAFMKDTYEIFDKFILEEFIQSLYKAFALLCGSHIAYCDLKAAKREHMLNEIIGKLCQGL